MPSIGAWLIPWQVHKSQVKNHCHTYGYANYQKFIEEMNKHKWEQRGWKDSLFDYQNKSEIHASVFKFEDKGMIMRTPVDYFRASVFIKKYIGETFNKKNIIKW